MFEVLTGGLQSTLQGARRTGFRHMGVPWSGPADPLSMALANRLVGNAPYETAIEITLGAFAIEAHSDTAIALTGAHAPASVDDTPAPYHQTVEIKRGQRLHLTPPARGVRTYLAVAGGFEADMFLGSPSTYLPAQFGGYQGRALKTGDRLSLKATQGARAFAKTPIELRPYIERAWALRAMEGPEFHSLTPTAQSTLFEDTFELSNRADRMGLMLSVTKLQTTLDGTMPSAPVFPGTVQCPAHGQPVILGCDAQTTGGYARVAQVAACDLHLLGQIRPGDSVRFLRRTPDQAREDLQDKAALFEAWIDEASVWA